MAKKELWKGNEAIAEAAIKAGCDAYFGYPITPQSEIPEYMSWRMDEVGKAFLQTESEVATINYLYGAAGSGMRVMTSTSSPGMALMQEGVGLLVAGELPAVIVNCMRGGPGIGTIQPGQADYTQMVKGGTNGDHFNIVLAPSNMQEAVDMVQEAFDLADLYRNPVMVIVDGMIGQMMEPIEWKEMPKRELPSKESWAAGGRKGAEKHHTIITLFDTAEEGDAHNRHLWEKRQAIMDNEVQYAKEQCDDAEILIVSYGTPARVCQSVVKRLREEGLKVGLFRPKTVWPYPEAALRETVNQESVKRVLCVEMSMGQMVDDVRLAIEGAKPLDFYGVAGGLIPSVDEIAEQVYAIEKEMKEGK